jgi:hypothetical protein
MSESMTLLHIPEKRQPCTWPSMIGHSLRIAAVVILYKPPDAALIGSLRLQLKYTLLDL